MEKKKGKQPDSHRTRESRRRGSHPRHHVGQLAEEMQNLQVGDQPGQSGQVQGNQFQPTQRQTDTYLDYSSREWVPRDQNVIAQAGPSVPPPSDQQQMQYPHPPSGWTEQGIQPQQAGYPPPAVPPSHAQYRLPPAVQQLQAQYRSPPVVPQSHAQYGPPHAVQQSQAQYGSPTAVQQLQAQYGSPTAVPQSHAQYGPPHAVQQSQAQYGSPTAVQQSHAQYRSPPAVPQSHAQYGPPHAVQQSQAQYGSPTAVQQSHAQYRSPPAVPQSHAQYGPPHAVQQSQAQYGSPTAVQQSHAQYRSPPAVQQLQAQYGSPTAVPQSHAQYGPPHAVQQSQAQYGSPTAVQQSQAQYGSPTAVQQSHAQYGPPHAVPQSHPQYGPLPTSPPHFGPPPAILQHETHYAVPPSVQQQHHPHIHPVSWESQGNQFQPQQMHSIPTGAHAQMVQPDQQTHLIPVDEHGQIVPPTGPIFLAVDEMGQPIQPGSYRIAVDANGQPIQADQNHPTAANLYEQQVSQIPPQHIVDTQQWIQVDSIQQPPQAAPFYDPNATPYTPQIHQQQVGPPSFSSPHGTSLQNLFATPPEYRYQHSQHQPTMVDQYAGPPHQSFPMPPPYHQYLPMSPPHHQYPPAHPTHLFTAGQPELETSTPLTSPQYQQPSTSFMVPKGWRTPVKASRPGNRISPKRKLEFDNKSAATETDPTLAENYRRKRWTKKIADEDLRIEQTKKIPMRKDLLKSGTLGKSIRVRTNMISIMFAPNSEITAVVYEIKFQPDKLKHLRRMTFENFQKIHFPDNHPAYDGCATVYSLGPLPFGDQISGGVTVIESEVSWFIQVTMTRVKDIDITWLKAVKPGLGEDELNRSSIHALEMILRSASYDKAIMVGRSFFKRPDAPTNLGSGMEIWTGLFQSAVLGWKTYFNVDIAHKAFPKAQGVLELMANMCELKNISDLSPELIVRNYGKIDSFLKGLKIIYEVPTVDKSKRTMICNGLADSPKLITFPYGSNSEEITVEEYFFVRKKYRLIYPLMPCLWIGIRDRHIYVPVELCTIFEGNIIRRKLDEFQTRLMIKDSATNTETRENAIKTAYNKIEFSSNDTMKEFGISTSGEFTEVDARILDPPHLPKKYEIHMMRGVWRMNNFSQPMKLEAQKWTMLNLSRDVDSRYLSSFVKLMQRNTNGVEIGNPHTPFKNLTIIRNDTRVLRDYMEEMKNIGMQLVIVIVPTKSADIYPCVKQVAELDVGLLTQCVKENTVRKISSGTVMNILHKINAKLNGENQVFDENSKPECMKTPCIFFGSDVSHPGVESASDAPSIAAVAASHDLNAFKYNITIQLQSAGQEIILQLEEIVFHHIKKFEKQNGVKPQKIIFYRDGASDSQFAEIIYYEIQAVIAACKKLKEEDAEYMPLITFLVVQKKHHIRLFPVDKTFSNDKNGNVPSGTVVDSQITHPSHIDFLLVSHASIQGVAKPTKYRCLLNQNNMSEDEIEYLTYYLCHMFSRCSRSVSYPAPTYYAHLAAFRARALTHNLRNGIPKLEDEQTSKMNLENDFAENSPMFFV